MNHKAEQQITTKKRINTLKIVWAFLIMGFVFVSLTFAAESPTQKIDDLAEIIHFIVSFLSRWRALLATLAGKLMSNDLIYWSFMNLDIFLWKIWNIMKNFANYTLWFMFLYMIIKSIISKDWANDIIKNKLVWFVLAWVLIQASWFLIWAVVDISTIAVTAISAIPGQIIQSDVWLQRKLAYLNIWWGVSIPSTWKITSWMVMTFDPNRKVDKDKLFWFITTEYKTLSEPITQDNYTDMFLPSYDTIAWPLIFFGTSIFQFQDYSFSNPQTKSSRKWLMEFSINLIIILMYSLAMFALVIINFFRMFYLWIVIIFSPFIILLWVFGKMKIIDTAKIKWLDQISISNVFKLIFKPVIFMAYISIMMIFVIWLRAILVPMNGWEVKINDEITMNSQETIDPSWVKSYDSSIKSEWIFHFAVNWAKKSIADLIVCFVTLFLMRFLIKTAVSSWSWIASLDKRLEGMTKSAEKLAWEMPIVPIGSWVWVNSVFWKGSDSLKEKFKDKYDITTTMWKDNQENLNKFLWATRDYDDEINDTKNLQDILDNDRNTIGNTENYNKFRDASVSISKEVSWWINSDNPSRQWVLKNRRNKYGSIESPPKTWWQELTKEDNFNDFLTKNTDKIKTILKPK